MDSVFFAVAVESGRGPHLESSHKYRHLHDCHYHIIPCLAGRSSSVVSPQVKVLLIFASYRGPCQFLVDNVIISKKDSLYYQRAQ